MKLDNETNWLCSVITTENEVEANFIRNYLAGKNMVFSVQKGLRIKPENNEYITFYVFYRTDNAAIKTALKLFVEDFNEKRLSFGFTGNRITWMVSPSQNICEAYSPLGTHLLFDAEDKYALGHRLAEFEEEFDPDEYVMRKYGNANYPLDIAALLKDAHDIQNAVREMRMYLHEFYEA